MCIKSALASLQAHPCNSYVIRSSDNNNPNKYHTFELDDDDLTTHNRSISGLNGDDFEGATITVIMDASIVVIMDVITISLVIVQIIEVHNLHQ